MNQLFSFTLTCPRCQRQRVIETYARSELLRLLELGHPIEARCTECDVHWPIPSEARVQIARAVTASFSAPRDRKSTRLNSSHRTISYAVFCLKKKKNKKKLQNIH